MEWIGSDEAWVEVTHFRTRLRSATPTYRGVREKSRWISLGPIIKEAPVD